MLQSKNTFIWGYITLVLFDLICGFDTFLAYRVYSKPLILVALIVYFLVQAKNNRNTTCYLMIGALICSLSGDVFLLFEKQSSLFFTFGLASFLIAHILYSVIFFKKWNTNTPKHFWKLALVLVTYGVVLFYILSPYLGSLKLPVVLYISAILAMAITAYRRKNKVDRKSFNAVAIGALLFVISDSFLAVDKFMIPIYLSHLIIMSTYAMAQYFITKGIILQNNSSTSL